MRAMSAFSREAGISTRVCLATTALRIRVNMSAIGSVIAPRTSHYAPRTSSSPATLRDARDVPFEREPAEAQAAQPEFAHIGARPAAQVAAVAEPHLELRRLGFLGDLRG